MEESKEEAGEQPKEEAQPEQARRRVKALEYISSNIDTSVQFANSELLFGEFGLGSWALSAGLLLTFAFKPREPFRNFKEYKVRASFIQQVVPSDEDEMLSSLPPTGFGTVFPPDEGSEDVYMAWALLVTGFLLVVPWIAALYYIRSTNNSARLAAILSGLVFLPLFLLLLIFLNFM